MAKTYTNKYGEEYRKVTLNLSAKAIDHVQAAARRSFRNISAEVEMMIQEHISRTGEASAGSNEAGPKKEMT